jgi:hypothetical protein
MKAILLIPPLSRRIEPPAHKPHLRAFTLTDLLVIIALLMVVTALAVAYGLRASDRANRARCTLNLEQVNRAILTFSGDHQHTLPAAVPGESHELWWWYKEQVKGYVGLHGPSSANDTVFACPKDRGYTDRTPFHLNPRFDFGSYVFNGVTLPGLPNVAGWTMGTVKQPQKTLLVMEWTAHAPLAWHSSRTGKRNQPFYCDARSVVGFVDGHVSFSKIYYDGYNAAFTRDPIAGYDYQYSGN